MNLDSNISSKSILTIVKPNPHRQHKSVDRLSFAFSSFSNPTSPRLLSHFQPKLTPDQIVDLARQANTPTHSNSNVFTLLPDHIYLPFLDRPAEVSNLISSPPGNKLFALLAQSFSFPNPQSDILPSDPTTWTYHHLIHHLTKIDRDVAPDFLWSIAARKCILSHSELIWERVKGALGIPPELDVDYDFLQDDQPSPEVTDDEFDSPLTMKSSTPSPEPISIQPLLASSNTTPPPSASLGQGLGLGDIAEGAEEEEEEENVTNDPDPFNSILPSQIQGLRISTSPLPSSPTLSSHSPPPSNHNRTSSVSSLLGPFNRSESTGALSSLWSASSQAGVFFSGSDIGDDDKEGDNGGDGMGPMFPGNFARLGKLRRSSSSSSTASRVVPHVRYVVSGTKEKGRAFSHAGGQRPVLPPAQRRKSWGALSGGS